MERPSRSRTSQCDAVLIGQIDPNCPDIAAYAGQHALDSDSESEAEKGVGEMQNDDFEYAGRDYEPPVLPRPTSQGFARLREGVNDDQYDGFFPLTQDPFLFQPLRLLAARYGLPSNMWRYAMPEALILPETRVEGYASTAAIENDHFPDAAQDEDHSALQVLHILQNFPAALLRT